VVIRWSERRGAVSKNLGRDDASIDFRTFIVDHATGRSMVLRSRESRYVARQLAWGGAVMWVVLTVAWAILNALPPTRVVGFAEVEVGLAAVYDDPPGPLGLYVDWMLSFLTLQWGQSLYYDEPVVDLYRTRLPVTLAYVLPGVAVSVLAGSGLSTYAAIEPESYANRAMSLLSSAGLSIPAFVLAQGFFLIMPYWLDWTHVYDASLGLTARQNLFRLSVPAGIVAVSFFSVQVRHARGETVEHLGTEYVKTVRAKGAGRLRTATHVLRNTWPALTSLVLGESLGLLLLVTIVVETILNVEGVAEMIFHGFASGDPMVSFTAVFGTVLVGVVGTLTRDFVRMAVDPRIER
jgi:peptide/nickel transport system permease protein